MCWKSKSVVKGIYGLGSSGVFSAISGWNIARFWNLHRSMFAQMRLSVCITNLRHKKYFVHLFKIIPKSMTSFPFVLDIQTNILWSSATLEKLVAYLSSSTDQSTRIRRQLLSASKLSNLTNYLFNYLLKLSKNYPKKFFHPFISAFCPLSTLIATLTSQLLTATKML